VEKRAEIVYGIMVRRGIVIEEYEDIMKAPADSPLPDTGAPRVPGQTSGTVDVADKKDGAPDRQQAAAAPETKEAPPPQAAEKAGEKAGALLPASKEGR
jgi:hypothetical protein